MTQEEKSRQARAADTKRRRTRDKLIHAADTVMREDGWGGTVEAIARQAGISTATYYTFYSSRNLLCRDAFTELVVAPLELTLTPSQTMAERIEVIGSACVRRRFLLRAALAARFEEPTDYPEYELAPGQRKPGIRTPLDFGLGRRPDMEVELEEIHDFVDRVARLLWQPRSMQGAGRWSEVSFLTALHAAALEMLDGLTTTRPVYTEGIEQTVMGVFRGPLGQVGHS